MRELATTDHRPPTTDHRPPTASPRHLVTPSPCHPVTPSPRHLVTPSPCHPVTLSPRIGVLTHDWLTEPNVRIGVLDRSPDPRPVFPADLDELEEAIAGHNVRLVI